jgi:outer membrane biosynthesis protein TonB
MEGNLRNRAARVILAVLLIAGSIIPYSLFAAPQDQGQNQNPDQNQEQPPANPQPQAEPAPQPQTPAPQEAPPAPQTPEAAPPAATESPERPRLARKKKRTARKKPTATPSGKVVVRNGGAKDNSAQLSPGMNQEQALHQRENTSQLLETTDANLKRIAGRQLTPAQQSTLDQIHTYMRQSKAASDAGDVSRARTLAYKAHLLSDELARK